MLIRLLHGTGIAVLLGCLAWLLAEQTEPVLAGAADLRGERWYRLSLEDRQVGYLHTVARRDRLGRWRFERDLRFALSDGNPVRTMEEMVFAGRPPYALLEARQRSDSPGEADGTLLERQGGRYVAFRLDRRGRRSGAPRPLDLTFTLSDYLGFEVWLREHEPPPGATSATAALDFGRRQVVSRQFRVVGRNLTGYELENLGPLDSNRIQLDHRLRPVTMTLSGLFELTHTSREKAMAPGTALQAASYFVPVDRPLRNHTEIASLALEVAGEVPAAELWPELARGSALWTSANAVSTDRLLGDELAETAAHPIAEPRLVAMAQAAVQGAADDRSRIGALTRFVNGYLRYAEDGVRRHVLALLDDPTGDCTEYAELLTTLARILDIPSRTIYGLAYADGSPPAFRFHAWNELLVDGEWHVVDPTWNQLRVDATHIPMPRDAGRALELLTGGLEIRFTVQEVRYF